MRAFCWLPLALCLCAAFARSAYAEPSPAADRAGSSGLGVGVGVGAENVAIGGHILYYFQLRQPRLRIALHAGAGFLPDLGEPRLWGMTGGAFFAYGKRNRLVVRLIGGTMSWETYSLYGVFLAAQQVLGVGVSAGWELVTRRGFFVRGDVGPALTIERKSALEGREPGASVVFSSSLGYKLW